MRLWPHLPEPEDVYTEQAEVDEDDEEWHLPSRGWK